jgi:cytosine/adenosine deaminase-related metal-dependent hydrolase
LRTLIQGSYVVAFDGNGHRIIRDGVVVFEGSEIVHVGKSYEGEVDHTIDAKGKLISPGFINIHALASTSITHLRLDGSMSALNVSKAYVVDEEGNLDLIGEDLQTSSLFAWVELLKGGATTSVAITPMAPSRWESPREQAEVLAKTAGELGARAYISHQYRSGVKYWTRDGASHYHWNKQAGKTGLAGAIQFAEKFEGSYGDRVRTMLFPYQFDTCSPELLKETKKAARERNLIIHMHAAQSLYELYESLRRYGKTPVQYLYDTGFLDAKVILTHVLYTTLNPLSGYPKNDTQDIQLLAESGTTVAHCPVLYSRGVRGEGMLRSFGEYLRMGCNMTLGTDTFPMDMIVEMRCAAVMGKVADRDPLAVTARDVFNAATLGGAKALGREDLGRLAPGAKADIVIVDLTGLHVGLIDDPIKTLVYMASQRDIETAIVDGRVVVEGGRVPGVDEEELAKKANEVNQRQKMAFTRQNPMGLSVDELFPPSFPIEG